MNLHPAVSLAFPPEGLARTVLHESHVITVCVCEKITFFFSQTPHFTSKKKEFGLGINLFFLQVLSIVSGDGYLSEFISLCRE